MAAKKHIVVRNGRVIDIRGHKAPPADILIKGDTIVEIGAPGLKAPEGSVVIDATNRLIHPGLINAHTHGHGNLSKGMGDRWTLELLLCAAPWISGNRSVEDKYLTTLIGAVEMLMKGCTACYDLTVEFPAPTVDGIEACSKAYADAGMRAVVAPMVANLSMYEAIPGLLDYLPSRLQKEVERLRVAPEEAAITAQKQILKGWKYDRDLIRPALAPTIPHHCTDSFMRTCAEMAKEHDIGLHSHIQESKAQVIIAMKTYGMTQTAHLAKLGLLGPNFTAAHGVWLDDNDIKLLADHGSSVAHNPGSNMILGSGIAAARRMIELGLNVGIGTDGAACSDNQNVYEAMRTASYASNALGPDTDRWLASEEILEAATIGSARALGFTDKIGKIAKGYKADLVFIDLNSINWIPCNDPTNQLVHTEDGSGVHSVMVGGRMVIENRKPVGIDLADMARKAEAARERFAGANVGNKKLFESLAGLVNAYCPGLSKRPYHIDRYAGCHHAH